jgi:hypothetical protein
MGAYALAGLQRDQEGMARAVEKIRVFNRADLPPSESM